MLGTKLSQIANIEIGRGRITPAVESKLIGLGWTVEEVDKSEDAPIFVRGTRRQLLMLIRILEDCNQPQDIREAAALELRALLDLNRQ